MISGTEHLPDLVVMNRGNKWYVLFGGWKL